MSATKNRKNRPIFIEKEESNQMGEDYNQNEDRNKLKEKQQDMFGSHQFQPNILNSLDKRYDFDQIDVAQHQTNQLQQEPILSNTQNQKQYQQQLRSKRKQRSRIGGRQRKIFDSDEEDEKHKQPQISPFQQSGFIQAQSQLNLLKKHSPIKQQNQNIEQLGLKQDVITIKQMVAKKQLQNKITQQIMMHSILDNVGINQQERRTVIYSPLQPNQYTIVYFKRYQAGFTEYFQVIGQDQRPIIFCRNQGGSIGCNYYFSLTKEMNKHIPAYLGKLRGNATGSIYQLYDRGKQPTNELDRSDFRISMAYIQYQTNILGMNGPRKLKVQIPKVKSLQDFDMYKLSGLQSLQTLPRSTVIELKNRQPKWNEKLKAYALNFGNRVKQSSLKNFILIENPEDQHAETSASNILMFGKTDSNTFFMEFRHPLSLFQATGIVISQFDFKLACQ